MNEIFSKIFEALRKMVIIPAVIFLVLTTFFAHAEIKGAHGMEYNPGEALCGGSTAFGPDGTTNYKANYCTLIPLVGQYVPHSGNYKVEMNAATGSRVLSNWNLAQSTSAYFDGTTPLDQQHILVSGIDVNPGPVPPTQTVTICYVLVDDSNHKYFMATTLTPDCTGAEPLPPTPPAPDTSCTINNGNALSVSLGMLERAELPTVADSGSAQNIPISVSCTGADVTVNMKLSYTPMTLGSSQAVKTSTNGVGVAIINNTKPLSTTDTTTITFLKGANTMNLAFQAVRDSTVELKDIPTGAFTASAVLEMTQQ